MSARYRFIEDAAAARLSRRGLLQMFGASAVAVGAGTVLSACGSGPSGAPGGMTSAGAAPKLTKVTISSAKLDTYLMDMVAFEEKLLGAYNLDVNQYLYPTSGVQGLQMLVANQVNMTGQDTTITLGALPNTAEGSRPQIVGMRMDKSPYSVVVKKGDGWPPESASFQEKMHALRGKTVGLTAIGAGADQVLKLALSQAGMQYTDVTPLAIGQTTPAIAQMQAGKIDAYIGVSWTSARLIAEQTGGRIMIDFGSDGVPELLRLQPIGGLVTNQAFLAQNKDAVTAWLAALEAAANWIKDNRSKAAALLNKEALGGKSPAIAEGFIEHFVNVQMAGFKPNLKVSKEGIDRLITVGIANGTIKEGQVTFEAAVPEWARA